MNDYNSDFNNNYQTEQENTPEASQPIETVSQTETVQEVSQAIDTISYTAQEQTVSTHTPYFNKLHEQPAQNEAAAAQDTDDSTYHYSYVKPQPEVQEYTYTEEPPRRKRKKRSSSGRYILKLIASALVFGLVAGAAFQGFNFVYYKMNPSANPAGNNIDPTTTLNITADTISTTTDLSKVVENVMPSIVSITSIVEQRINYGFWGSGIQEAEGAGSGIIIGKNDTELLIVTNYHVIKDAKSLSVGFIDTSDASAIVKGYDSDADLAVVAVPLKDLTPETKSAIKVATLGKSSILKVGEPAIAIGNALGYGQSVTAGYVSALDREVALTDKTMTLLQTDAAINPGNSGGALLNIKGEVIGINTVKYSDTTVEGMGYAIPIDTAAPIIKSLMSKEIIPEGQKAYLGISGVNITESYSQQLNLPQGIYIQSVQEDSPADKGGIHAGDVITKFNGNSVSTMENLIGKLDGFRAGDQVEITVKRMNNHGNYEDMDLTITLGAKTELQ